MSTKDWIEKDYYKVLGVPKDANPRPRSRRRTASWPARTTRTKHGQRRGRGAVQGDLRGERRLSATPRSARSTTRPARSSAAAASAFPGAGGGPSTSTWATSSDDLGGGSARAAAAAARRPLRRPVQRRRRRARAPPPAAAARPGHRGRGHRRLHGGHRGRDRPAADVLATPPARPVGAPATRTARRGSARPVWAPGCRPRAPGGGFALTDPCRGLPGPRADRRGPLPGLQGQRPGPVDPHHAGPHPRGRDRRAADPAQRQGRRRGERRRRPATCT